MSGLFGELARTTQALNAQSQGIITAGRNMANVNNPAYARQRVQLGDRGMVNTTLGARSLGVEAIALENVRDSLLDKQVLRETSLTTTLEAEADAYFKAQISLGQQVDRQDDASFVEGSGATEGNNGVGAAIADLLGSFSSLAASPRSDSERQITYHKAQTVVDQFGTIDGRLESLVQDIDANIDLDVARANDLISIIAGLNKQIGRYEASRPGTALDLRDQRQAKLEELSAYFDFNVEEIPGSTGQIRLLSQDAADAPVVLLESNRPFTPLAFDGTSFSAGGPPAITLAMVGGSLHGRLTARDGAVASLRSGLDELAAQVVSTFNATYNPGGASTDFFAAVGITAATIALDASLTPAGIRATNTTNPGANEVALAISDLSFAEHDSGAGDVIDGTLGQHYLNLVSNIANSTATAQNRLEDQGAIKRLMFEQRDAISGVSLDEEMAELVKYQRAFDASARVMRVIDEMLETVVNGLMR